jgi:uncharacterized membrane protein HdeD (DUF308 family)
MTTAVPTTATGTPTDVDLPWWLGIVQGIALLVLGALCLSAPGATLVVLVQLVGIYWLVTGILELVGLIGDRTAWGWKLFAGIIGILAGIAIVAHPMWATILVPTTLVLVIGIFGIISGVMVIVHSFGQRRWTGVILGIFGVLLGLILVANPLIGAATLPFVIGSFALVGGIMSIAMAFYERRIHRARAGAAGGGSASSVAPPPPAMDTASVAQPVAASDVATGAAAADDDTGASPTGA